jgi:RNA polymerase sigma-70 factor (ECF subfamily)
MPPEHTDPKKEQVYIEYLVKKSQSGDGESFGELYDIFLPRIYRYVYFRVHDAESEDITEEIFLRAWEKINKYSPREGASFSAWLFKLASNSVADHYRQRKEHFEIPEYFPDESRLGNPKQQAEGELDLARLKQALKKLPEKYQQVLVLRYINDLSHKEIAKILKKSEGAVRILVFRGLGLMRTVLQKKKM